jgi:serine protease
MTAKQIRNLLIFYAIAVLIQTILIVAIGLTTSEGYYPEIPTSEYSHQVRYLIDPNISQDCLPWNLKRINLEEAWNYLPEVDSNIIIAILDTGVAYEDYEEYTKSPVLNSVTFVPGYDFTNNDTHPNDDNGHGTFIAHIIAEDIDCNNHVSGISHNISIMPLKVLDSEGRGTNHQVVKALRFAYQNGAKIIHMSFGWKETAPSDVAYAIIEAYLHGCVLVAAAGNEGTDHIIFPASHPATICVGATTQNDLRLPISSYGNTLDLVAPGVNIRQTIFKYGYQEYTIKEIYGTSFSSPHVTAVIGLILSYNKNLNQEQVREILLSSAFDIGEEGGDIEFGAGIVNAGGALEMISDGNIPEVKPLILDNGSPKSGCFINILGD